MEMASFLGEVGRCTEIECEREIDGRFSRTFESPVPGVWSLENSFLARCHQIASCLTCNLPFSGFSCWLWVSARTQKRNCGELIKTASRNENGRRWNWWESEKIAHSHTSLRIYAKQKNHVPRPNEQFSSSTFFSRARTHYFSVHWTSVQRFSFWSMHSLQAHGSRVMYANPSRNSNRFFSTLSLSAPLVFGVRCIRAMGTTCFPHFSVAFEVHQHRVRCIWMHIFDAKSIDFDSTARFIRIRALANTRMVYACISCDRN